MTFRPAPSRSVLAGAALATSLVAASALSGTAVAQPPRDSAPVASTALPLGPANLAETRETRSLQPGVTLTTIVRGQTGAQSFWTVEVAIPSSSPDPDAPAAALSDKTTADATAAKLRTAGLDPRVEDVPTPKLADAGGNSLGYRVRLGSLATKAEADVAADQGDRDWSRRLQHLHRLGRRARRRRRIDRSLACPGADDRPEEVPRRSRRVVRAGSSKPAKRRPRSQP